MTSSEKSIVAGFISEISKRAGYGIRGEKPLAVLATLKYLHDSGITGKKLLELLAEPHIKVVKSIFLDLAREHSSIKEPGTSWDLITGKRREIQDAIQQFRTGDVNEAFSRLTPEEIESLLKSYVNYLTRSKI